MSQKHLLNVILTSDREYFRDILQIFHIEQTSGRRTYGSPEIMEIHHRPSSTGFLRKSAEERNKMEKKIREKERGGRRKKESGRKKPGCCGALPGVCVVFTFQHLGGKPSGEGVQTHTHTNAKGPRPFSNRRHTSSSPPCGYESSTTRNRAPSVFLDF